MFFFVILLFISANLWFSQLRNGETKFVCVHIWNCCCSTASNCRPTIWLFYNQTLHRQYKLKKCVRVCVCMWKNACMNEWVSLSALSPQLTVFIHKFFHFPKWRKKTTTKFIIICKLLPDQQTNKGEKEIAIFIFHFRNLIWYSVQWHQ